MSPECESQASLKALFGCAVQKAEAFLQDVEQESPAVQRAADKAVTASSRSHSAAKPTEKGNPADASQRIKPPTSIGKASEWKTRSRPNGDLDGKKALVDPPAANDSAAANASPVANASPAANASAAAGLAARVAGADALAMMPPIPGPPLTQGTHPKAAANLKAAANGDPSSSRLGKQKNGSGAVLGQAGGRSQKAGADLKGKAPAKPVTFEAEGTIHWLCRPNCSVTPVCPAHLQSKILE